jgi:hypothetical protein
MSRFVSPAEVRIPISDGDYLIVKNRLNAGEQLAMYAAMRGTDEDHVDPLKVGHALIQAYLLDWSITDDAGHVVSIRNQPPDVVAAVLTNLEYPDFEEIRAAIRAHEDAITAARQEKKQTTGDAPPVRSSPWPVAVTGASSG